MITLLLITLGLNINIKDIKKIKELAQDKEINYIVEKLPENVEVCKEILNMLDNKDVVIENLKEGTVLSIDISGKEDAENDKSNGE